MHVAKPTPQLTEKHARLLRWFSEFERVVVAYSGGVDSAFVAKVAFDALGGRATAMTARSPSLMKVELDEAIALANDIGIAHEVIETHELNRPDYVKNDGSRCYFCKDELFDATALLAERLDGAQVVDGFNADDFSDHRPGHQAAHEHGVRHPLADVGLTKAEIRSLSKDLGLPTWKKPQLACLSSRLPYGMPVTPERLSRIETVETALRGLGFFDVRARLVHENDAMLRLEVGVSELQRVVGADRTAIISAAHGAGFRFVTLDLEGFRSGRMNEGLVQLKGTKPGRLT